VRQTRIHQTVQYFGLFLVMAFTLLPFLWMLDTTFKVEEEIFASVPVWWIKEFTWDHYIWAMSPNGTHLDRLLANSFIVCAVTAVATGVVACLSGYGLARYKVPGVGLVVILIVLAQMIQGPLIMIPWYKMAAALHLLNTKAVLTLIYGTMTIPVGVWIMSGFFKTIPRELEEAAHIDGAGRLRTLFGVMVPLALPGLVAVSLYAFILGWNDYQYALILTNSLAAKTVQIGIAEVMDSMGKSSWGGILASGVIVIMPVVLLFAFIQRFLIEGLTAGSVKG
jgi:ABC-type glycerol-3-phosphate transport system permease component